ncbi:MAG TPA: hypothetical protein VGR11_08760 [Solirubrobacteraceae bacterium]|nr:hypothetical protein [Solirubrobacteraceae bacterium]
MADHVILRPLDGSPEAARILDEFESRTGLLSEAHSDGRLYELYGPDHQTQIVQTLTEIDPAWTDRVGLKLPA